MDDFQQELIKRIQTLKGANGGFDRQTMRWSKIYFVGPTTHLKYLTTRKERRSFGNAIHINDVTIEQWEECTPEILVSCYEVIVRRNSIQM